MSTYQKPVLRSLGRMDVVTRKSGPDDDFGSEPSWTQGDWQSLCDVWPWLPWCNGPGGATGAGTGSFG